MTKPKARELADRESKLVCELQRNHDWLFFDLPKKDDRTSMLFKRKLIKGKETHALIPARKVFVAFPSTSPVAVAMDRAAKAKENGRKRKGTP